MEYNNLVDYERAFPKCMYSLHQLLARGRGSKGTETAMHCLIKNVNLYWGDFRKDNDDRVSRWMTPRETLVCQGFPMAPGMEGRKTCSFHVERFRKRTAMKNQAGNSMHVHIAGLCFLYSATQTVSTSGNLIHVCRSLRNLKRKRDSRDSSARDSEGGDAK